MLALMASRSAVAVVSPRSRSASSAAAFLAPAPAADSAVFGGCGVCGVRSAVRVCGAGRVNDQAVLDRVKLAARAAMVAIVPVAPIADRRESIDDLGALFDRLGGAPTLRARLMLTLERIAAGPGPGPR